LHAGRRARQAWSRSLAVTDVAAERDIERLYGLPLGEFTPARNALVRDLRKAGRKDDAEAVRGLRKPPVSAWVVNQLARRKPEKVGELLKAGDALRKAQRDLLAGKSADVRKATREQHALVDDLVADARQIVEEAEGKVSPAMTQRVATTLRAASTDAAASKLLRKGRLTDDVESIGFGPLLHVAPDRRSTTRAKRKASPARARERQKRLAEARARIRAEREALEEARRAATAAQKAAANAEREVERAVARLETAERKAAALQQRS
jgi:hypothetical protein